MNQKIQIAIIIILIVVMYIQPSILGKFANCCLGKAMLLGVVIFLAVHNTSLGLLAAIVLISSIYAVNREGFDSDVDAVAKEAAAKALKVINDSNKNTKKSTPKNNDTPVEPPTTPPSPDDTPATSPTDDTPSPAPTDDTPAPAPTDDTPAPAPTVDTPAPAPTVDTPAPSVPETFRNREGFDVMGGIDLIQIEKALQSRDSASLPILHSNTKNNLPKENALDNLILFSKGPLPLLS